MVSNINEKLSDSPHHVTQRGNRRQQTFFNDEDYLAYLDLMAEWCDKLRFKVWGYCLMPDHMHLIAVPETEEAGPELSAKPIGVTLFSESPA